MQITIRNEQVWFPPEPEAITHAHINAERDRRILSGTTVTIAGVGDIPLQGGAEHERNLQGLAFAAQMRVASGDTETITVFRDGDNQNHNLTPLQVLALWQGGAAYISQLYQASWALKALDPIPQDYRNDSYWSAV